MALHSRNCRLSGTLAAYSLTPRIVVSTPELKIQIHGVLLSFSVGLSEAFYVDFWLAILAEYLATLFFMFAVSGSSLRWEGAPTIFQQALAAGLCTASSIQAFRSVSLPLVHANPVVSLAAFITGDAGLIRMVCSVLAQMFGGEEIRISCCHFQVNICKNCKPVLSHFFVFVLAIR